MDFNRMMISEKMLRYWRTLRYLKPIQVVNRLKRKIAKPSPDFSAAPPLREWQRENQGWQGCAVSSEFRGSCFSALHHSCEISTPADWNCSDCSKLWLYNLHYFDFLRTAGKEGADWIQRWMRGNAPGTGNGWEPYPLSLRIVNWIKYHWRGYRLSEDAIASLAAQTRFLAQSLEYHLLANHLLANAKALIFAGRFFGGREGNQWAATGWEIYRRQLPEQILADGAHFERSLMYHSIILEDLLDVRQATGSEGKWLDAYIERMLVFLAAFTGPDGRIALWNDAAFNIAPIPEELFAYAGKLGFRRPETPEECWFEEAGYWRSRRGSWTLWADAGAVGPDYQPGHAHADTLSFELFYGNQRVLVDSGTSAYQSERRGWERSTAAHNTLMVDGRNSSEVWGAHRVGARARVSEHEILSGGLSAQHDGYRPISHRRSWRWRDNRTLEITDEVTGSGIHDLQTGWHFHPDWEVEAVAPGEIRIGRNLRLLYPKEMQPEILDSFWSSEFGRVTPNRKLQLHYHGTISVKLPVTITVSE